jgi:hypothetical protein
MAPSWTDAITTKVGSACHYITCQGHLNGKTCAGYWSRRDRQTMSVGLHCVYGGWISFDGNIITEIQSNTDDGVSEGRNLPRLRRLWAENLLSQASISQPRDANGNSAGILDEAVLDQVHEMLHKVIAKRAEKEANRAGTMSDREKMLGKGTGGWSGVTDDGAVLKRDTGNRKICNYMDRCDKEPGGMWQRGDVEVWTTWNGWSCLVSRDGRWRPGYHLEVLLSHWLTVVDYGLTRAVYRDRQANWMRATEWIWMKTPFDVPLGCVKIFESDIIEMIVQERQRAETLKPETYVPNDASTSAARYQSFQDRGGEIIAYHTVGEGLETPRGLVATWNMAALNDIVDYERDVLCGERNNCVRSLTSEQQVVDAAAWVLESLGWALDNHDYDLSDAILGSGTLYLVMWRYSGPKLTRYRAISIQDRRPGRPPELMEIANIVQQREEGAVDELPSYGELFRRTAEKVQTAYGTCTCYAPTEGHDACKLFAQAMNEGGNDDIEERLLVAFVALNNGANNGDLRCECGVDLLLYESFIRFLDPEAGIVARLHYRSGTEGGNTITE